MCCISPLGSFGTVPFFCYNSLKSAPIGFIFNMMRISSRATNCTKGVLFCLAVFEKLATELGPSLSFLGEKHYLECNIKLVMCGNRGQIAVL